MRKLRAALAAAALALSLAFTWGGNGSENLPCSGGAHWVLAPSDDVTSSSVTVAGVTTAMSQNGNGSWAADSTVPVDSGTTVTYTYTGDQDPVPHLQLSHCLAPAPPTTPPPTTPPPTSPPGHDGGGKGHDAPPVVRPPSGLAYTGTSDTLLVLLAVLAGSLLGGGIVLMLVGNREDA